ncbi:hypothetical protein [Microbacterium sp. SD291]|uniref:hypothetical protein n=1 Tax=Microbacterium sp. SD291 TaxID=2782007 RepID=UPI001A97455E|nr:hypothetical protein [Microbacterium sp. SD291]MBO0982203.1 hypothetical protein [Microbacterium sp. SD291]
MSSARELAAIAERSAALGPGDTERFSGYAVMALPFSSGHVLGLRRFPVTSVGPGYTSVWLRRPAGGWSIYPSIDPSLSCPRYFGSALESTSVHTVTVGWTGDLCFTVRIEDDIDLHWDVTLANTPVTKMMSGMAGALPDSFWRSSLFLSAMGAVSGPSLRAGRIGMIGHAPNRQLMKAKVKRMWVVEQSTATLGGEDLGTIEPLREQSRLGEIWMPQRGIFMIGGAEFEPQDAEEHPPTTKAAATV